MFPSPWPFPHPRCSPDNGGHAFTLIYSSSLKIFISLEYGTLITTEKNPQHVHQTQNAAACNQHTDSLFSLFSIWLFTCFVLTAICPLLLLSVSDTDFVPSHEPFFLALFCTLPSGHCYTEGINFIARLFPGAPQALHFSSNQLQFRKGSAK